MKRIIVNPLLIVVVLSICMMGCNTVYNTKNVSSKDIASQSSLVFVRPDKYTLLGTKSLRTYTEVVYEEFTRNSAGQPVVKFGLRNRGGKKWYDLKGPNITIAAKAVFYNSPVISQAITSAPVYETNWQRIPITRGETIHYTFTSPVSAGGYQVTLSDAF